MVLSDIVVEIIARTRVQSGYIINTLDGEGNQKIFLNTIVAICKKCEELNQPILIKLFLEREYKLADLHTNGWRTFTKDTTKVAYKVALDIVYAIKNQNRI